MCLSAFVLWAFAHGCENSRIYLDKVFRTGVQDGGNLVRTDLCLSQYLDTYIFNLLHFATGCGCIPNRCMERYYIYTSSMKKNTKHNALGSLMDCSVARQEWLLACLPTSTTYQHTPTPLIPGSVERERQAEVVWSSLAFTYIIPTALSKSGGKSHYPAVFWLLLDLSFLHQSLVSYAYRRWW